MWLPDDDMQKRELVINPPLVNAASSLGFYPNPKHQNTWENLGAFITNPISFKARQPADNRLFISKQSYYLMHTGLANPGFKSSLKRFALHWAKAPLGIIVHLLAEDSFSLQQMVATLETCENVVAVELSFSDKLDWAEIESILHNITGELPLILCLTLQQVWAYLPMLERNTDQVIHIGGGRGAILDDSGNLVNGQLVGFDQFLLILNAVQKVSKLGIRVIGGGGIISGNQVKAMFKAGAQVIALDCLLWQGGVDLSELQVPIK